MGKTLHILPRDTYWPIIVKHWIGSREDMLNNELLAYPLPANEHYYPKSLSDAEMMRVVLSWENVPWVKHTTLELYEQYRQFADTLNRGAEYDKVIVWVDETAESKLLLSLVAHFCKCRLFIMDITPNNRRYIWEKQPEGWIDDIEVKLFDIYQISLSEISRDTCQPRVLSREQREECNNIWTKYAGSDALDTPYIINQFGSIFHPYRTYLYSDIFSLVPKAEPRTAAMICGRLLEKHPQLGFDFIRDSLFKMADEGFIKYAEKDKSKPLQNKFIQYKYDVEGDWNRWPRDFVYQFIRYCGKRITMSEDDMKAEFLRDRKDSDDMFCQGHLARADRAEKREQWEERLIIQWAAAFNANWGWYHLMSVMKVKLGMMVEYMRHWTPIANGQVYADQMERAISLMEIIIDWGGQSKYAHTEDEEDYFDAKHFSPYVNMRNRKRFPSPDYDGHHFWCKAQRVRFDKAWNILWEMFRTKMLSWED